MYPIPHARTSSQAGSASGSRGFFRGWAKPGQAPGRNRPGIGALLLATGLLLPALVCVLFPAPASAEEVTFTYTPAPGENVQSVSVRGDFNSWGETPMEKAGDGVWSATINLDPGEHLYKFFVNGQWPQDMAKEKGGGPVDPDADRYADDGYGGQNAVRVIGGSGGASSRAPAGKALGPAPELQDGFARIHYHRPDGQYTGWGLHVWEDTRESVTWASPMPPTGKDGFGPYWDVRLTDSPAKLGFLVHRGDEKDPGPDMFLDLSSGVREAWIVSSRNTIFTDGAPDIAHLAMGDLTRQRAHWIDPDCIVWEGPLEPGMTWFLHSDPLARLELNPEGITAGQTYRLEMISGGIPPALQARFPHLAGLPAFRAPDLEWLHIPDLLRGQTAVSAVDAEGRMRDATGLQIPGVVDALFEYDGPLGAIWEGGAPTLYLWAPTARQVSLCLFDGPGAGMPCRKVEMRRDRGIWSVPGETDWKGEYYLYEIEVFMPSTGKMETNRVTDPYARGLSANSEKCLLVDLDDPALKPEGWDLLELPGLAAPEDITLYELHVRDFSAQAEELPEGLRGTFEAFTRDHAGTRHLRSISQAGLTHLHLLPVFDIATVNENRGEWKSPGDLSVYGPASEEQQAAIARIQGQDGFNWGYDPFHFGVPEGSYATNPDGPERIVEFRRMVQALSQMGLRTVMDVVYNHTHAHGNDPRSVLDRIVPGYYHRLNRDGGVETSTCCSNTATEHAMMERLMVDDLVHWSRDYKVAGFRFDLMGHHMVRNMETARDALAALTPEQDGIDGTSIYLYGEGWDFGEVGGGARGRNATQINLAGTGIGTFNDRFRDAARGGNPFGDRREQGFITGLYLSPNGFQGGGPGERDRLLDETDRLRIGLAGNLRDYLLRDRYGRETGGAALRATGYTTDPQEAILYVSAHDNETLFDKIQYSAPADLPVDQRARMQMMGISLTALGQGIPFFHAGVDLMRSKSMDADSYNSGDWFNQVDWSGQVVNFGVGLPIKEKNGGRWDILRPILSRGEIKPGQQEIQAVAAHMREMLQIRRSSPLFRLRTADDVRARVRFHNTGPDQIPGLIVMSISDEEQGRENLDPEARRILVLFNSGPEEVEFRHPGLAGKRFALHPVQAGGADPVVKVSRYDSGSGACKVPGRTTTVFVEAE